MSTGETLRLAVSVVTCSYESWRQCLQGMAVESGTDGGYWLVAGATALLFSGARPIFCHPGLLSAQGPDGRLTVLR